MKLNSSIRTILCISILFLISSFSPAFSKTPASSHVKSNIEERKGYSRQTVMIYLIGFAGTGKYTIAKKISEYGYKVVDNHLINNPIFSLLGKNGAQNASESATEKVGRIRHIVLQFVKNNKHTNYVLTNQLLENDYHHDIYNKILHTAKKRNSIFIPIMLVVSSEERARRIVQPERAQRFKPTDVKEAYRPRRAIKITHENLIELNVTHLTADEAARKIMEGVQQIIKAPRY